MIILFYNPSFLFSCSLCDTVEMADIGSEYGVPQLRCKVKQEKMERDKRTNDYEETDAEACEVAAASIKVSTEGMGNLI